MRTCYHSTLFASWKDQRVIYLMSSDRKSIRMYIRECLKTFRDISKGVEDINELVQDLHLKLCQDLEDLYGPVDFKD